MTIPRVSSVEDIETAPKVPKKTMTPFRKSQMKEKSRPDGHPHNQYRCNGSYQTVTTRRNLPGNDGLQPEPDDTEHVNGLTSGPDDQQVGCTFRPVSHTQEIFGHHSSFDFY
jgi:hypothetical protein